MGGGRTALSIEEAISYAQRGRGERRRATSAPHSTLTCWTNSCGPVSRDVEIVSFVRRDRSPPRDGENTTHGQSARVDR